MVVLDEALKERGEPSQDIRVAVQGFGNVGANAARLAADQGARIVAVADHMGGVSNDDGLDINALYDWAREHRTVKGFVGGEPFDGPEVITWDVDVSIPAAHEVLVQRGVLVVPDILVNAGGVTISYVEWVQNIQQFSWQKDRVDRELTDTMRNAYAAVREVAEEYSIDLRTAVFVLAIRRSGDQAIRRSGEWAKRPRRECM